MLLGYNFPSLLKPYQNFNCLTDSLGGEKEFKVIIHTHSLPVYFYSFSEEVQFFADVIQIIDYPA